VIGRERGREADIYKSAERMGILDDWGTDSEKLSGTA